MVSGCSKSLIKQVKFSKTITGTFHAQCYHAVFGMEQFKVAKCVGYRECTHVLVQAQDGSDILIPAESCVMMKE